jgi:ABC-type glycerol-3-phosphate transport system substrate-binding protein
VWSRQAPLAAVRNAMAIHDRPKEGSMRKRRAPFIALLVMLGAVALVSSAGGVTASGAAPITLTYVDDIYGDPVSVKSQQAMIKSFEKQNPNVKI